MIKQIFRNLTGQKSTVDISEIAAVNPDEAIRFREMHESVQRIFGRSLRIRQVDAGSCNACEWECIALVNPVYDVQRFGVDFVASPRHADMLLVTGPVSRQMELALRKTYLAMPEPRFVIACGDCAFDGGVYRGSYAVTNGVANVIPVNAFIAGCPPAPIALLHGILKAVGGI